VIWELSDGIADALKAEDALELRDQIDGFAHQRKKKRREREDVWMVRHA
jgi:hypothetical protein